MGAGAAAAVAARLGLKQMRIRAELAEQAGEDAAVATMLGLQQVRWSGADNTTCATTTCAKAACVCAIEHHLHPRFTAHHGDFDGCLPGGTDEAITLRPSPRHSTDEHRAGAVGVSDQKHAFWCCCHVNERNVRSWPPVWKRSATSGCQSCIPH